MKNVSSKLKVWVNGVMLGVSTFALSVRATAGQDDNRVNEAQVALCKDHRSKDSDCYDPVSYFNSPAPTIGKKEIVAQHGGVNYRFSSEENKKQFLSSPEKFVPAYNGWCAYGVANNKKITVDPLQYTLTEGKLHLFYKDFFVNTRSKWVKDEAKLSAAAHQHWASVSAQKED